tara:strand:+ start:4940 stop:5260 length:321 start_codon:yes stop_codon:yes gene_type:complete
MDIVDSVAMLAVKRVLVVMVNVSLSKKKSAMESMTTVTDTSIKAALNIHAKKRKKAKHNDVPSVAKKVSVRKVSGPVQTVSGVFVKQTTLVLNKKHATDLTTTVMA